MNKLNPRNKYITNILTPSVDTGANCLELDSESSGELGFNQSKLYYNNSLKALTFSWITTERMQFSSF